MEIGNTHKQVTVFSILPYEEQNNGWRIPV